MPLAQLPGVVLNYAIDGADTAPPLLLSNSLGASLPMWEPQLADLCRHFRVIRYDSRGHGKSSVPPGPYTMALHAADVVALLDHLQIARTHYCGLSMGGAIGQWLALHSPQRLDRLILCNTAARIGTAESWTARIEKVSADGVAAIAPAILERWFSPQFRASHPEIVAEAGAMMVATPTAGYVACCIALRDFDVREELVRIATPTLVIAGQHDQSTPVADGRFLAERIAGARVQELDAAHISNIEQPGHFNAAVLGFLR